MSALSSFSTDIEESKFSDAVSLFNSVQSRFENSKSAANGNLLTPELIRMSEDLRKLSRLNRESAQQIREDAARNRRKSSYMI